MEGRYGPITGAVYFTLHHPSQPTFALVNCPLGTPSMQDQNPPGTSRVRYGYVQTTFNNQLIEIGVIEPACWSNGELSLMFNIRGHSRARVLYSNVSWMLGLGSSMPDATERTAQTVELKTHEPVPHSVEGQIVSRRMAPGQDYTINVPAHVKEGGEAWSMVQLDSPFMEREGGEEVSLRVLNRAPWLEENRVATGISGGAGEGKVTGAEGYYYVRGL